MQEDFFDVNMTDDLYQRAVKVGTSRDAESKRLGCRQACGCAGHDLETDILGAAGEFAYCIYTNQPWSESVNTFKAPDVGDNVQVRATKLRNGRLIVRGKDKDNDLFVLVVAEGKKFKIVGSILGKDAKHPDFVFASNDRPEAWFVDQKFLTKIEDKREKEDCPKCMGKGEVFIEGPNLYVECSLCEATGKLVKK